MGRPLAISRCATVLLLTVMLTGCQKPSGGSAAIEPPGRGPYAVGSSNLEVATAFAGIGDDALDDYLLGRAADLGQARFLTDALKHPDSAFVVDVPVPSDESIYGPAQGQTLPVVTYITFPTDANADPQPYVFPYHDGRYGTFEHMLGPGERPRFADPTVRYPLVIFAHGTPAHGLYDVRRAHDLASHGYIVAVLTYGDDRTRQPDSLNRHTGFLRPLLTKAVLDALLASDTYGPHIDADRIGIAGHSYGGFTSLAVAGGPFEGNPTTVHDTRIKAAAIAAPWVGGTYDGTDFYAFGPDNTGLARVSIPILSLFGSKDDVTLAAFIVPAMQHLSGPTYVVELVDQPHIFDEGSWQDRENWEAVFFAAYLKYDAAALSLLKSGTNMQGGSEDWQLFQYQKLPDSR
ncbi:MAG: hypothetical protein AAGH76_16865 [Pseudomonadota bacterium]